MNKERKYLCYIKGIDGENGENGVIIATFDRCVIVGTAERHGGDSEAMFDIETAKIIVEKLNQAIEEASKQ